MTEADVDIGQTGLARRRFLAGGAVAVGAWAAPSILVVRPARAAVGSPQPGTCQTTALDVLATFSGPVAGTAGPARACQDSGGGSLVDLTLTAPGGSTPVVTIRTLSAACSQTPCRARAEIASVSLFLTAVGIPATITATALESEAECTGGSTSRSSSIATVTVNGTDVAVATGPNTTVFDQTIGTATVKIVANEQQGNTVNALRISAHDTSTGQSVDVIVASATASC